MKVRKEILLLLLFPFLMGSMFYKEPKMLKKAEVLAKRGKVDEAIKIYKKEAEKFSKRGDFQFNWALLYLKKKDFQSALDHFRLAFANKGVPKDLIYYNMGKTFEIMKKYNKAVEMYKLALLENPYNNMARHNLELLLKKMRKGKGGKSSPKIKMAKGSKQKKQKQKIPSA